MRWIALPSGRMKGMRNFIQRLAPNRLARRVKIVDLEDNMDLRRLDEVTPKAAARLNKYCRAWQCLTEC